MFYDLQLELIINHGPISFHQQINHLRFPLVEYLLFVPREITSIVSKKDINSFTDKLMQYIELGKAVLLSSQSNFEINKEAQTISCSNKRILKHSIPACLKIMQNDPSWNIYKINIESKFREKNNAEQFTEQLISNITESSWNELDHMLLKAMQPEITKGMKHNIFVTRVGKTEIVCFTQFMSKMEILEYVTSFDSSNAFSITIK